MKFRRLGAFSLAAALMATTTAIYASADMIGAPDGSGTAAITPYILEDNNMVRLVSEPGSESENPMNLKYDIDVSQIYGFRVYVQADKDAWDSWHGGKVGRLSALSGWDEMYSYSTGEESKELTIDIEKGTIEFVGSTALFDAAEQTDGGYAAIWFSNWNGENLKVIGYDLLDKDGNVIAINEKGEEAAADETADEEDTAEDTTAAADEDADEVVVEDDDDDDDDEDFVEEDDDDADADDDAEAEAVWVGAGAGGTDVLNDNLIFDGATNYFLTFCSEPGNEADENAITEVADFKVSDIYGFKWYIDYNKTAWDGWHGGKLGTQSALGGSWNDFLSYVMGEETEGLEIDEDEGTVTWVGTEPLFSQDEQDLGGYAKIWFQTWDGGNVKVVGVDALDKNGNALSFGGDVELISTQDNTATTGNVDAATDSSKGSPDTGVADVAAVAGLAVVAAGAAIVAKKRK